MRAEAVSIAPALGPELTPATASLVGGSDRTRTIDRERINDKMERFETSRTPPQYLETFEATYPAELRRAHDTIFALLEADDARLDRTAGREARTPP